MQSTKSCRQAWGIQAILSHETWWKPEEKIGGTVLAEYPRSIQDIKAQVIGYTVASPHEMASHPSAVAHHAGPQGFSPGGSPAFYGHFDVESNVLNRFKHGEWYGHKLVVKSSKCSLTISGSTMEWNGMEWGSTCWDNLVWHLHRSQMFTCRAAYCWINPKQPCISSLHMGGSIFWGYSMVFPNHPFIVCRSIFHGINHP